jgi:hypothetical protein
MKTRLLISLSSLFAIALFEMARAQPSTNEQMVTDAVEAQVDESFEGDSGRALLIIPGQPELDILVAGAIADAMRHKYPQVMLASSPSPSADNLTFDIQGFDFRFRKGASRGFLKAHKIKRELQGQLRITIKSGTDGQLREVKDIPFSSTDVIEPGWAKYVDSRSIPELAPLAPSSSWSRYVEPALVITAVGTLVYLFFANR